VFVSEGSERFKTATLSFKLYQVLSDSSSLRVQASPKRNETKGGEYDYHTFGYNQLLSGGTVTTSLCTCVWFLWRTTLYYIAQNFEHRKQCKSTAIIGDDNQLEGNACAQSQLVNAFISACGYNDTHVRDYANPVDLLWEFTVCQGAPRHLLQLVEKISSVFLWATLHLVGFTHCTTRDQDERDA
jgi:hypothetical protein